MAVNIWACRSEKCHFTKIEKILYCIFFHVPSKLNLHEIVCYGVREGALRRKYMLLKKIYTFSKNICFLERIYLRKNIYFS